MFLGKAPPVYLADCSLNAAEHLDPMCGVGTLL